ncbi:hypothetical protein Tco_1565836, partial [Tanacetum coccineum]
MALGYQKPFYLKQAQQKQQSLYNGKVLLEKHDPPIVVFVSEKAKSREELYFSNTSKMATVSKLTSIPNEEFSDDTSPSVARKFLNEKAAKFVRDFKSLTNKADESLAKHKDLEFEIERLLRVVVSQDIMSIVQNPTVVETSDLQTELE